MNTIKRPTTLRELGDMCQTLGINAAQGLEVFGPWPTPPAGYTLAPGSDDRWLGPEVLHRKWIITPVWNSTTDAHSLDVWLAEHHAPTYAELSTADAQELAADLAAAQAIGA